MFLELPFESEDIGFQSVRSVNEVFILVLQVGDTFLQVSNTS